jgi:hypothetical protein
LIRGALAGAVLVSYAAGFGRPVSAQEAGSSGDAASAFGGFQLNAKGDGLLFTYDIKNVFPVSPIFQAGMPEAQATLSAGPASYALASLAWPGALVADIGSALAQGGQNVPIPPYPVRAEAHNPGADNETRRSTVPGTQMDAIAQPTSATGTSRYTGADLPTFIDVDGVNVIAHSALEDGLAVSRSRSTVSGVDVLFGLLHFDSVDTDIVASSNGSEAKSGGLTKVTGATVLGLKATVDATGVHLAEALPPPGGPLAPLTGPVFGNGSPLKPVGDALAPVAQQLSNLITQTVGAGGDLNALLEQAGVRVRLLAPTSASDAGTASRTANGLAIQMTYGGSSDARLASLLALLPSDQLPSDPLFPGAPFGAQGAVNMFKETHIAEISLATAGVDTMATPAFDAGSFDDLGGAVGDLGGDLGALGPSDLGGSLGSVGGAPAGFSTPTPALRPARPGGVEGAVFSPISAIGDPVPAALAILVIMTAPMWAGLSRRLAESTLGATAGGCPYGKEDGAAE